MDRGDMSSKAPSGRDPHVDEEEGILQHTTRAIQNRPGYMYIGSGSTSESAAQLAALIEDDSGYGGSVAGSDNWNMGCHSDIAENRPSSDFMPENLGATEELCMLLVQYSLKYNESLLL